MIFLSIVTLLCFVLKILCLPKLDYEKYQNQKAERTILKNQINEHQRFLEEEQRQADIDAQEEQARIPRLAILTQRYIRLNRLENQQVNLNARHMENEGIVAINIPMNPMNLVAEEGVERETANLQMGIGIEQPEIYLEVNREEVPLRIESENYPTVVIEEEQEQFTENQGDNETSPVLIRENQDELDADATSNDYSTNELEIEENPHEFIQENVDNITHGNSQELMHTLNESRIESIFEIRRNMQNMSREIEREDISQIIDNHNSYQRLE